MPRPESHAVIRQVEVIEDGFHVILDGSIDYPCQITARQTGKSSVGNSSKDVSRKSAYVAAALVDKTKFSERIASLQHLRQDAHSFCNRIVHAPEVDQIATRTKARCFLYQRGLVAAMVQPMGKG